MEKSMDVFARRKASFTAAILIIAALFAISSAATDYDPVSAAASIPKALAWMVTRLVPDRAALEKLPNILSKLMETTLLSIAATVTSGICAFFFSLFGSSATRVNSAAARAVRAVASFFRNVPDVAWAMLLMFSFGQNVLTGYFALFFSTFGFLTRTFIETIDEVSSSCIEALTAAGASFLQIVFQGVIPSSVSELLTWVLFMIETNIRSSTLIGMLTATGVGYLFDLYYKRLNYSAAGLIVICLVLTVLLIETVSGRIRKVIL